MLEDLASSLKPELKPVQTRRSRIWKMPEQGWVKVNTDAAFDSDNYTGSAGVIIRDQNGSVLAAATRWLDNVPDVLTADALAAKEGLELATECGYDKVILEVDCSGLKTILEASDGRGSSIGGLCVVITGLGRSFTVFRVVWVIRDANSVAHTTVLVWCRLLITPIFGLTPIPDHQINEVSVMLKKGPKLLKDIRLAHWNKNQANIFFFAKTGFDDRLTGTRRGTCCIFRLRFASSCKHSAGTTEKKVKRPFLQHCIVQFETRVSTHMFLQRIN